MNKAILAAAATVVIAAGMTVYAFARQSGPKFVDFPAEITSSEERPPLQLSDPSLKLDGFIEILLQTSYKYPVNFAGHYVFVTWGAGPRCDTGAALDTKTGTVHLLQIRACDWRDNDSKPFHYKADSTLLVLSGKVDGIGKWGAHYFEFNGGEFNLYDKTRNAEPTSVMSKDDQQAAQLREDLGNQGGDALKDIENPSSKEQPALANSKDAVEELGKAVMFAVHRPVFNSRWKQDAQSFDYSRADKVAKMLIETSVKREYLNFEDRMLLFYQSDADLFGLIVRHSDGKMMAGFLPGRWVSEELYKIPEGSFLETKRNRTGVVKSFFDDFSKKYEIGDFFISYQMVKDRSIEVNRNLVTFLSMIEPDKKCLPDIQGTFDKIDFRFADNASAKSLGAFYLSMWFIAPIDEQGTLSGVVSFRDRKTNRYGGLIFYDRTCKITRIVNTVIRSVE